MRIEQRTYYITDSGCEFRDADECAAYEDMERTVAAIMAPLAPRPKSMPDGTYLLHDNTCLVTDARIAILTMSLPKTGHVKCWVVDTIAGLKGERHPVDPSWAGRLITNLCPQPMGRAWRRLSTIDEQGREWEQQYYVRNPHEGNGVWDEVEA